MKKTWTIIIAVALVAAIAVGGTLAYLSQQGTVTNTFTVSNPGSHLAITLLETATDANGVAIPDASPVTSNIYNVVPGKVMTKDPTITIGANSCNCYVFAYISNTAKVGSKDTTDAINVNTCWKLVSPYTDLYVYCGDGANPFPVATSDSPHSLTPVFSSITINGKIDSSDITSGQSGSIVVKALAYQSDAVTYDSNLLSDVYSKIKA